MFLETELMQLYQAQSILYLDLMVLRQSPIGISNRWMYIYNNLPDNDYSAWVGINQNTDLLAGEGFTMKGPGSGGVFDAQNYVFSGKPNNGNINLSINSGNNYLVGNPYPSALDAKQFIIDNGPAIDGLLPTMTGTIYFYEHWGGGSHVLADYLGGYATYNLSGFLQVGIAIPNFSADEIPIKISGRYIAVGQGFFVVAENTGTINFNNGQRVFQKEEIGTSLFFRNSQETGGVDEDNNNDINFDDRMKFRLGLNSVGEFHRQLLLTIDENASIDIDWGYDGEYNETQIDDMFWMINDGKYSIQGSNVVSSEIVYPIGILAHEDGLNTIGIDELENVPNDIDIFIHDIENGSYHNLRDGDFQFFLPAGEHLDKFELTFAANDETLSIDGNELDSLDVFYSNAATSIGLFNPNAIIVKSIEIYSLLGQKIETINNISEMDYSEYPVRNLSTGTYIINLNTISGLVSKKVIVR